MSTSGTEARLCLGKRCTRALTSALKKCNAKTPTPSFGVFSPLVRAKLAAQHQRQPWWGEPGEGPVEVEAAAGGSGWAGAALRQCLRSRQLVLLSSRLVWSQGWLLPSEVICTAFVGRHDNLRTPALPCMFAATRDPPG